MALAPALLASTVSSYTPPGYIQPYSPIVTTRPARAAAGVTTVGGALLFLISFFGTILGFVFGGLAGGFVFLVFGLVPGVVILAAGVQMQRPGADMRTWGTITIIFALLSFFSFGGLVISAVVSLVGGAMALAAASEGRNIPATLGYAPLPPPPAAPPPPPPAPVWSTPTWAPPPPPPPQYTGYNTYSGIGRTYTPFEQPAAPPPPPPMPVAAVAPPPTPKARVTATPIPPTPLESFLNQDPDRSFDLEGLNAIDFGKVTAAIDEDKSHRGDANAKAQALLTRLQSDISDINTVDDLLRDRLVIWFRDSPSVPSWATRQTPRWAGLIAETRTAGGARTSALLERLSDLRDKTAPFQGPARKAFADFRKRGEEAPAPASSTLPAQVVQAVLDDLASAPRTPDEPFPLLRLSELAVKVTPAEANRTLADLFKAEPAGPFVILHPSRFPEFGFVLIRPPPPGASGAAVAYELLSSPADQPLPEAGVGAALPAAFAPPPMPVDPTADLWARDAVGDAGWAAALAEFERRRERIPTPPPDFRRLPPYFELRKLVVTNPDIRRTFLAVRWRGKPPGLALLAQLLSDRSLEPDVETDAEYLEAELSDLERGDVNWKPATPTWTIASGVRVTRTGDHGSFSYALQ